MKYATSLRPRRAQHKSMDRIGEALAENDEQRLETYLANLRGRAEQFGRAARLYCSPSSLAMQGWTKTGFYPCFPR